MIRRRRVATVVALLVATAILVGLVAGGVTAVGSVGGAGIVADTSEEPDGNETVPHENPDAVAGDGDDERMADYLSSELSGLLGDGVMNISESEYDQARDILGDDYDDTLGQFVEVAGDTDQEETAETFDDAREEETELADLREGFEETHGAYEDAVEEGDEEQARELARELAELAEQIDGVAHRLDDHLERLENDTGLDLSDIREEVNRINQQTNETATEAIEAELIVTEMMATAEPSAFSFQDPARISGTLETEDGDPVADMDVKIRVGEREYEVRTDSNGSFTLEYRPVFVALDADAVSVAFVPDATSPYTASDTTVEAAITEQTDTGIEITDATESAEYDDAVSVSGTVTVAGNHSVGGLPVVVTLDGERLAGGETRSDGTFDLEGRLPAEVDAGDADLRVAVPMEDAAVDGSAAETELAVGETDTTLSLTVDVDGGSAPELSVSGSLTTTDGDPVGDRALTVFLDGDRLGTIGTASDGSYEATFPVPDRFAGEDGATVRAEFDGTGTNLGSAEAEEDAVFPAAFADQTGGSAAGGSAAGGSGSILPDSQSSWLVLGGLVVLLVVIAALAVTGRLPQTVERGLNRLPFLGGANTDDDDGSSAEAEGADDTDPIDSPDPAPERALLEQAEASLAAGDRTAAVQAAYGGVRAALASEIGDADGDTHWEFYRRCQRGGVEAIEETKTVTRAYELATFAPDNVPEGRAREAVSAALDVASPGERGVTDGGEE